MQKRSEELVLDSSRYSGEEIYHITTITLGMNYDIMKLGPLNLAAGSQLSYYVADNRLNALYGKNPMAGEVFIRIYPRLFEHEKHTH